MTAQEAHDEFCKDYHALDALQVEYCPLLAAFKRVIAEERERCAKIAESAPEDASCCGEFACDCRSKSAAKRIRAGE